jgi:hypothetical protein
MSLSILSRKVLQSAVASGTSNPNLEDSHEIWEPKPPGNLSATPGLLWDCFTITVDRKVKNICNNFSIPLLIHFQESL